MFNYLIHEVSMVNFYAHDGGEGKLASADEAQGIECGQIHTTVTQTSRMGEVALTQDWDGALQLLTGWHLSCAIAKMPSKK